MDLQPRGDEPIRAKAEIVETALAVGHALNAANERYAISGGAALALMGGTRPTGDMDVYIPTERRKRIEDLLLRQRGFAKAGPRIQFAAHRNIPKKTGMQGVMSKLKKTPSPYVDVPLDLNQVAAEAIHTIQIDGVNVLHPRAHLNVKCEHDRHDKDAKDIKFLAKWMVDNNMPTSRKEIPECYKYRSGQAALKAVGAFVQ